jgi:subtilisin family serine protease
MNRVICPNCHALAPCWLYCSNCGIALAPADKMTAASGSAGGSNVQMDAHLHRLAGAVGDGRARKLATASTPENEVAVIARVNDKKAFSKLKDVKVSSKPIKETDTTWLLTARMPLHKVKEVRQHESVQSLKASQRLRPCLEKTLGDIGVASDGNHNLLLDSSLADGGSGILVGIIDFGMDFRHKNFRDANGKSRILAIWDQRPSSNPKSPSQSGYDYDYGTLYTQDDINAALEKSDPYAALGYGPPADDLFQTGAHGTYVADVAAGNGRASTQLIGKGVASNADIIFVEASTQAIPTSDASVIGTSFGDSVQLVEAINFIFDFADKNGKRPCVINLSMGTNGGPHDGSTLVEKWIDCHLGPETPNRAVVIAAANQFGKKMHATGTVSAAQPVELKWHIFPNDATNNELEIWYSKDDQFDVEVIKPGDSTPIAGARFGETKEFPIWEHSLIVVVNRKHDSCNGDNTINVFLDHELVPGEWIVRLRGVSVTDGRFHAWIERDENGPSQFEPGVSYVIDDAVTLGSIACGQRSIVVGSYDAHQGQQPLSANSGSGPTRNGRKKPDLSAPGENVLAAYSRTLVRRNTLSGTSMSAPAVAGVIALMLAEAKAQGISLSAEEIRDILIRTARKDPPLISESLAGNHTYQDAEYGFWHPRYGFGRVSAAAAVAEVTKRAAESKAAVQLKSVSKRKPTPKRKAATNA